ncbi:MAG: M42 family metallopeptidase [Coprobacillaceae bacterium]
MADLKLIEKMTLTNGISGHEKEVSRVMKSYIEDCTDAIEYDVLGSIIGIKKGTEDVKFLLTGHIDEIGFIVKEIDAGGYIKVNPVGGWMGQNLPSSLMTLTTREGKQFTGVFGSQAPHGKTLEERNKVVDPKDAFIDFGIKDKQEAKDLGIRIGDPITPKSEFNVLANNKYIMSKAFDDRIGACVIIDVLRNLKDEKTKATIYGAGTVQEEVGLRGAKTVGQMVKPDIAIAIDVTFSQDLPGEKGDVKLGCGAVLSVMDGSVIAHTGLLQEMEAICEAEGINFELDMLAAGGTDSGELSKVDSGVVNMTLSLPSRYMHSNHTIIHQDDYDATVNLLTAFIRKLDRKLLDEMIASKQ